MKVLILIIRSESINFFLTLCPAHFSNASIIQVNTYDSVNGVRHEMSL